MAKLKKSNRKPAAVAASPADLQAKAEQLSRGLAESAQHIWLAGVGAFQRAQSEGSKLFDALVKEGSSFETATRKIATGRVDAVRDAVEERVDNVRERAVDTWDRLEKVFEERVQRALTRLGVPGREDLAELSARVDQLTRALKQRGAAAGPAARKPVARKTKPTPAPAKPKKASAKPAAAKKAAVKPARKAKTASPRTRKSALASVGAPDAPQG